MCVCMSVCMYKEDKVVHKTKMTDTLKGGITSLI